MDENNLKRTIWHGRLIRYVPLILWICVILFASSGQGSMTKTSRFIGPLLEYLFPNASADTIYLYHHYIRKLAHLSIYFILAFWAFLAFSRSSTNFLKRNWFLVSLGLVALVASIDEINQSFDSSRAGSIYDVLLDIVGGLAFLLIPLAYKTFIKQNN